MRKFLIVIITLGVLVFSSPAEALRVTILSAESGDAYQVFSATFISESLRQNLGLNIFQSNTLPADTDLIIAVGIKSASIAIEGKFPVLCVLVSKAGFEKLISDLPDKLKNKSISAIYFDQPIERKMALVAAALPDARKIGLLYSSHSVDLENYRKAISEMGFELVEKRLESPDVLFRELETILETSDVLLTVPDASVYNPLSMRNVLLTTYRFKVPVVGLSPAYVRAGALCAVFSSPEQIAVQATKMAMRYSQNGVLAQPQYPIYFNVSSNLQVARSLGIHLKEDAVIVKEMMAAENKKKGGD